MDSSHATAARCFEKMVYSYLMDHLLSENVLKYHRGRALVSSIGIVSEPDSRMPTPSTASESGAAEGQTKRAQVECECLCCHRTIAASRFAPHMEKCIGMGRNSSRVARRRLANMNSSVPSSASQSPRVSTRISTASEEVTAFDIEEEYVEEDDEWSNSSAGLKRKRLPAPAAPPASCLRTRSSRSQSSRLPDAARRT